MSDEKDWDVASFGPPTPAGPTLLRCRGGRHEVSTMVPVKDGQDLSGGELVNLRPREDGLFDVETLYDGRSSGPAMVNSESYRDGWESVFGGKQKDSALN